MSFRISVIAAVFCLPMVSGAIPELRETRANYDQQLVTIYPDHAQSDVYYFLPNSSEFSRHNNGMPAVGLSHWGTKTADPSDGGGILSFVLSAGLSPQVKSELIKFKQQIAGARLTVVPFGNSYVTGPSAEVWNRYIESIELPPQAGVAETEVGVNMLLTEMGAKAFIGVINGAVPFNVQLCFDVYGTLPMMDAEVRIRYDKVYEHFAARGGGGFLWWSWSVKGEVEKLIENGMVHIKILGGDATFEDYIKALTDEFIKTYMKPTLANTPTSPSNRTFSFNYTKREERKEVTARVQRKTTITDTRCLPLAFKDLKPWAKQIISSAD